jgi:hypothetical protein
MAALVADCVRFSSPAACEAEGVGIEMQQAREQGIGEHRHRPEHGHAGDRVSHVFIVRVGHRVGGDDGGSTANGCPGGDQLGQFAIDAQQFPHPDRKGERGHQRRRGDADTAAADLDDLGDR